MFGEKEAVYNLKLEGVSSEDGLKIDQRIKENKCGVDSVSFDQSVTFEYAENLDAPYHVQLTNIINEYGVSGSDEKDTINMYIYSDFNRKTVAIPTFNVTDDELLEFYDFYIPCQSELIISMVKSETDNQETIHRTLRLPCNEASVGFANLEFRFYD
jgi:hypothetical protein